MEDDPFFIGAVEGDTAEAHGSTEAEIPVDALVPSTILKELQLQPHLSASVFGYDIQQMSERPWAKSGANMSDYFNYGFNEKTWRIFCSMQAEGKDSLVDKAESFYERIEGITNAQREAAAVSMYNAGPSSFGMPPPGQGHPYHSGGPSGHFDRPQGQGQGRTEPGSFFKTKMCQRFQEGRCARGAACNFAHGAHELRSAPQYQPRDGGAPPRMPYPAPMGGSADGNGVLGMPPPMGGYMPMSGGYMTSGHTEASFQPAPQQPPSHTGFRMAPTKRDRGDDHVFEQGLE